MSHRALTASLALWYIIAKPEVIRREEKAPGLEFALESVKLKGE